MKNAILIVQCKTGFAVLELDADGLLASFTPHRVQCYTHLDHYSRHETVIEAVKEHFAEKNDA